MLLIDYTLLAACWLLPASGRCLLSPGFLLLFVFFFLAVQRQSKTSHLIMDMAKISPEAQTTAAFIQLQTTGHSLKMGAQVLDSVGQTTL